VLDGERLDENRLAGEGAGLLDENQTLLAHPLEGVRSGAGLEDAGPEHRGSGLLHGQRVVDVPGLDRAGPGDDRNRRTAEDDVADGDAAPRR